mmetsp:Transcript_10546/g.30027  ORF Transcript_10546/g.30027 Transcript_10546/m.30027 type:complete len:423 (-) Transcript_10546:467-1735(-)
MQQRSLCLLLMALASMPFCAMSKKTSPAIYGPIPLASNAEKSQFVVLAMAGESSSVGGYCKSSGSDWRAWMPIYLATALGKSRPVLIWDNHPLGNSSCACRVCLTGSEEEARTFFECKAWLKSRGLTTTRLLLILGTGMSSRAGKSNKLSRPKDYPDIHNALSQPWVDGQATRVLHFPITHIEEIVRNLVFRKEVKHFDVVPDSTWLRPVHRGNLEAWTTWCQAQPKARDLLYVAHFHSALGQYRFLAAADPDLLTGYTIHFYNTVHYTPVAFPQQLQSTAQHLREMARKKRIKIVIHNKGASLLDLSIHSCRAMGLLHYPVADANPRAVYEALGNGLSVFVSKQAHIPYALRKQPFVKLTSSSDSGLYRMNEDLADFMERIILDRRRIEDVYQFAREKLDPHVAYYDLFESLGIAKPRSEL